MYLRSQLDSYASQIADQPRAAAFRAVVDRIQFDARGLCLGAALSVFTGTGLEDLRDDFEVYHVRYLTMSDIMKLVPQNEGEQ